MQDPLMTVFQQTHLLLPRFHLQELMRLHDEHMNALQVSMTMSNFI